MGGDNLGDDPKGAWARGREPGDARRSSSPACSRRWSSCRSARCRPASRSTSRCSTSSPTRSTSRARRGQQVDDTELIETALGVGRQMIGPELRMPGVFDPEQPVAGDAAPEDRLLAFAGRKV